MSLEMLLSARHRPAAGFLLPLIALLLAAASGSAQSGASVPLVNPGMESPYVPVNPGSAGITGEIASGWSDNSYWGTTPAPVIAYSQDTVNPHSGASSQKVVVTSVGSSRFQMVQQFAQQAGNVYTISAWVRGSPGVQATLSLQQAGSPYATYLQSSVALTSAWQQVTATGYITTSENVLLMFGMSTPGTVWADDFAVSYTFGSPSPTPVLGPIAPSFFGMHVGNYQNGSLRNAGFEPPYTQVGVSNGISGNIAVHWVDNSSWASPAVVYSQDTSNPHGGTSCQKVAVASPGSGAIQFAQPLTVIPGRSYTFSAWLRGDPGLSVGMILRQQPSPYTAYAQTTAVLSAEWQQFTISGVVGDTGDVYLMFTAGHPGAFWVDDVAFTDAAGNPVSGGVPWPQSIFGQLRLWDSDTAWTALEPVKGVWDWDTLDMWVDAAESHGVREILLTLGQSPGWASSQPDNVNYIGAGAPAPPSNVQDWRDYIAAVGQRYKGRIRNYEIWNEPNDPTYYSGTVAQLVQLTQEAYQILKAIDPANVVVAPVPYQTGYLDQLLAAGVASWVDVIPFHIYTGTTPPESVGPAIANVRLIMANHGVSNMPFWDTEGASGDTTVTGDQAAAWLVRRYLVDLAYGSIRYDWYAWSKGSSFCLATEQDNPQQLTEAGIAFRILQRWLYDASLTGVNVDASGTWQMSLTLGDGSPGLIVWNPSTTPLFAIPSWVNAATTRDIFGGVTLITGPTITVTSNPVLLSSFHAPAPSIATIASAADRISGLAPGGLGVISGSGWASSSAASGPAPLPASLADASVFVDGIISPVLYAGPGQLIFQVPSSVLPGPGVPVFVDSANGASPSAMVPVSPAAPAVFQSDGGRAIGFNPGCRPAASPSGSELTVCLTGVGAVSPEPIDGAPTPALPLAVPLLAATATVNGLPAPVLSLHLVPGLVGVAQATIQLPALDPGDYPLVVTMNGVASTPATVSVGPTMSVPRRIPHPGPWPQWSGTSARQRMMPARPGSGWCPVPESANLLGRCIVPDVDAPAARFRFGQTP